MPDPHKPQSTLDQGEILKSLRALRAGDLAHRMPIEAGGLGGEIAEAFNDIVESQVATRETVRQLSQEVKKLGYTRETVRQLSEQVKKLGYERRESAADRTALEQKAAQSALRSRYKSEFLANMSHELRTPLNSLLILAQLLAENAGGTLTPKQVEYAQTIHISGNDLLALIDDILDLSKVEAGKATLSIADGHLPDLQHYLEQAFRVVANKKSLQFRVSVHKDLPVTMLTDMKRLRQILKNLLSNAFKFTEKGAVSVEVVLAASGWSPGRRSLDEAQKVVAFSIIDTGIGIAKDKQQIIFEAFRQGDGTASRRYEGTGLGLSISAELARLLGGEIRVASSLGKGSTFTLYLPIAFKAENGYSQAGGAAGPVEDRQAHQATSASVPPGEGADRHDDRSSIRPGDRVVLNVVDDAKYASRLLNQVRALGFKGLSAANAHTAIALANEYMPNVVTIGIKGQDMGGWALLNLLREDPLTRKIPVNVFSIDAEERSCACLGSLGIVNRASTQATLREALRRMSRFVERKPRNLLVAARSKAQRQGIVDAIADEGRHAINAATGKHALKVLRRAAGDCAMIVQDLADMRPLELVRDLFHSEHMEQVPIVVRTVVQPDAGANQGKVHEFAEILLLKRLASTEAVLEEIARCLHEAIHDMPPGHRRPLPSVRPPSPALAGKSVLIVDDDIRSVYALANALEQQGMTVSSAEDGPTGLEMLKSNPDVDIIFMDMMMPGQDGYHAMRVIRGLKRFRDIPIIAVTGKAMKGDREKCIKAGASDYIAKPVDLEHMVSVLELWLADKQDPRSGAEPTLPPVPIDASLSQIRTSPD